MGLRYSPIPHQQNSCFSSNAQEPVLQLMLVETVKEVPRGSTCTSTPRQAAQQAMVNLTGPGNFAEGAANLTGPGTFGVSDDAQKIECKARPQQGKLSRNRSSAKLSGPRNCWTLVQTRPMGIKRSAQFNHRRSLLRMPSLPLCLKDQW